MNLAERFGRVIEAGFHILRLLSVVGLREGVREVPPLSDLSNKDLAGGERPDSIAITTYRTGPLMVPRSIGARGYGGRGPHAFCCPEYATHEYRISNPERPVRDYKSRDNPELFPS